MAAQIGLNELKDAAQCRVDDLGLNHRLTVVEQDFSAGPPSSNLLRTLGVLISVLSSLNTAVRSVSSPATLAEVHEHLGELQPAFNLSDSNVKFKLLMHICSQIQTERLIQHNAKKGTAMDVVDDGTTAADDEDSMVAFQLEKICSTIGLGVTSKGARAEHGVCEAILTHLRHIQATQPELLSHPLPRILSDLPPLDAKQSVKLRLVEDMLFKDFEVRREMLMKRMELTVESFLWSPKAEASEARIRAAVVAQRSHLRAVPPTRYQMEHALRANTTLLQEQSKRVTTGSSLAINPAALGTGSSTGTGSAGREGGAVKSIVKQVLVGDVPDRGGRANEVRSKQLKEDLRRSFGHDHGGGGGGRSHGGGGSGAGKKAGGQQPSPREGASTGTVSEEVVKGPAAGAGGKEASEGGGKGGGGGKQQKESTGGILERAGSAGRSRPPPQEQGKTGGGGGGAGSGRTVSVAAQGVTHTEGTAGSDGSEHKPRKSRNRHKNK